MTAPDFLAQLCFLAALTFIALKRKAVLQFVEDCMDGNVCRLERIDRDADEAGAILAMMGDSRWT